MSSTFYQRRTWYISFFLFCSSMCSFINSTIIASISSGDNWVHLPGKNVRGNKLNVVQSVTWLNMTKQGRIHGHTSCGRVGRGGNARFHTFRLVLTNGPTDRRTNGRTKALIELRVRNYKCQGFCYVEVNLN